MLSNLMLYMQFGTITYHNTISNYTIITVNSVQKVNEKVHIVF